ncbi:HlyD family secretion protein [Insolitispirillum peregrinum]|uniref:HlyD family secretion protein n=1 Tax=Insolitispirillum peregrinum TaxID=80876 RepID=UPI003608D2AA
MPKPLLIAAVLGLLLTACDAASPDEVQGYAEGEYRYIALPDSGMVTAVEVRRGQQVQRGQALFSLDDQRYAAAVQQAEALLAQAEASHRDLLTGQKGSEIRALEADARQAEANLTYARQQFQRQEALEKNGYASRASFDEARASIQRNQAAVNAAKARLATARDKEGRDEEIHAARAAADAARAALEEARAKLALRHAAAPADGRIEDILFRPGEGVSAGQAVVMLLPDDGTRVRFFIPPEQVGQMALGQRISVRCPGCAGPITAAISFIAAEASYTPPVLYSRDQHHKLVFMVEATPLSAPASLHPGQPLTIAFSRPADAS